MTEPKKLVPVVDVLDDAEVRRQVDAGELVRHVPGERAPVDPEAMKRLRANAARSLKGRPRSSS
jgi:hypothetical protein